MSIQNKIKWRPFLAFFQRFVINFLENALEFIYGVTWRSELKRDVSNSIQNVIVLSVAVLVINFCTYCSNVERNSS